MKTSLIEKHYLESKLYLPRRGVGRVKLTEYSNHKPSDTHTHMSLQPCPSSLFLSHVRVGKSQSEPNLSCIGHYYSLADVLVLGLFCRGFQKDPGSWVGPSGPSFPSVRMLTSNAALWASQRPTGCSQPHGMLGELPDTIRAKYQVCARLFTLLPSGMVNSLRERLLFPAFVGAFQCPEWGSMNLAL